jgi:hypothetical protein
MVCNRHACADHLSMGLKTNDLIPNEEHPGPTCFEEAYIFSVSRRHTKGLPPGDTEKEMLISCAVTLVSSIQGRMASYLYKVCHVCVAVQSMCMCMCSV